MKIVFLADALDTQKAGIHYYCKGLLQALDELKTNHQLYVVRSKAQKKFKNITEIEVSVNDKIPFHQRWRQLTTIPKIVNHLAPDVVMELAHFGPFNLKANIKRVTFIHDISPILFPQWHPKASVWAHRLLLKNILKKTDLILSNSNFTKTEIIKKYPFTKNKTEVTHLACNFEEQPKTESSKSKIASPYFLYLGTIEPRKNITTLIKAFEIFKSKYKTQNINLVLAGAWGWKYKNIESTIKQSSFKKNIICKGFVKEADKIELIKNAIAFIYPSLYEGFGLPVIEAMQLTCPVICSDIGSLKEVGQNHAFYFEPKNENDLCKKMIEIINNPISEMQKKSLINHSQKFTWAATAKKTLNIIEQI